MIWEELKEVVSCDYLFVVLSYIQLLCSVPSLNIGFPDEIFRSRPIPSLNESVPLFYFDEISIFPGKIFVDTVVVLDVIDVNLLVLKNTLEYQLVVDCRITFYIQVNIGSVSEVKSSIPS